jgi:membrane-associated phospholipid phosphatase
MKISWIKMRKTIMVIMMCIAVFDCIAQQADTVAVALTSDNYAKILPDTIWQRSVNDTLSVTHLHRQHIKQIIIPFALTAYGYIGLGNSSINSLDRHIKEEVWTEDPHQPDHFDDWLQYMPGFSVYVLNGLGVQGKNNLLDATRQYLISSLLMTVIVQSTKSITKIRRPDGYGSNAFPSGHTSTVFVAAEFLNQEYGKKSPLYSVTGYAMATLVGYMRLYNNKHWFKDVVAGAGIGMGVTRFVYWIYPSIKERFFKDRVGHTLVMPYYQNGVGGVSVVYDFHKRTP